MRLFSAFLVAAFALCSGLPAQAPDPHVWVPDQNGTQINLYDRNGALAAQHPIATPWFFNLEGARLIDGSVWLIHPGFNAVSTYTAAGPQSTLPITGIQAVAPDVSGGVWTLETTTPFGPLSVALRDSLGNPLVSITTPSSLAPLDFTSDPFGNSWVVELNSVWKFNTTGALEFQLSSPGSPGQVQADALGQVWIRSATAIQVIDNGGTTQQVLNLSTRKIALDPLGRIRALVDTNGGSGRELLTIDPQSFAILGTTSLTLPGAFQVEDLAFDAAGQMWAKVGSTELWLFSADGTPVQQVSTTVIPQRMDGSCGGELAGLLHPNLDSDGDGLSNGAEIRSGSDPFQAGSVPVNLGSSGPFMAGQAVQLLLNAPAEPGHLFLTAASFSAAVGDLALSPYFSRTSPLLPDALTTFWFTSANPLLPNGPAGQLDAAGQGSLPLNLPPGTTGASFLLSALTVDPSTQLVKTVAPVLPVTIF